MSHQVSAAQLSFPANQILHNRRSAGHHPNIWGDQFLSYDSHFMGKKDEQQHQKLKEEVQEMLSATILSDNSQKTLELIDSIERLGVSYHFKGTIDKVLQQIYIINFAGDDNNNNNNNEDDIFIVSLQFRLLRRHGYNISSDVFKKFEDDEGTFKKSLTWDIQGMLNLYEATHLRVHGEDILDKALAFTRTQLESAVAANSNSPIASQIHHALKQPFHKGIPRLEARYYFSIYQENPSHNQLLLKFAKLDFNLLQKLHRRELCDIARWWKDLDFANKLPFARDRVVECYFWILGVYYEPEYALARWILTKVIAMTSVLDDIYDVYATMEEIELLTPAIERWDISAIHELPEYMKWYYQALLDVYNEIEEKLAQDGRSYRLYYAKEAMKNLAREYYNEAKWLHQKYVPTMEEYMSISLVTCAYPMLVTTSFVGMGEIVTKHSFDWLHSNPKIVKASAIICRLMDDVVSYKFEQKRGHVASSIACYTKQYGATEEEAIEEFRKHITNAWKDINEECLNPTSVPMPLLARILNLARVIDVIYKDEDGYTHSSTVLKDFVTSILIDPLQM